MSILEEISYYIAGSGTKDPAGFGVRRSGPGFYQMMARLEREGWWRAGMSVGDQAFTERHYRIRPAGSKAWAKTRSFYEAVSLAAADERWSHA